MACLLCLNDCLALYNCLHEYLDFPNKYRTVPMHTDYPNKTENKN